MDEKSAGIMIGISIFVVAVTIGLCMLVGLGIRAVTGPSLLGGFVAAFLGALMGRQMPRVTMWLARRSGLVMK